MRQIGKPSTYISVIRAILKRHDNIFGIGPLSYLTSPEFMTYTAVNHQGGNQAV